MRRIELPDGQWADVISEKFEVTERRRRLFAAYLGGNMSLVARSFAGMENLVPAGEPGIPLDETAVALGMMDADLSPAEMLRLEELNDALIVSTLEAWSLDRPLPTVEQVIDLPPDLVSALRTVCASATRLFLEAVPSFKPTVDVDASTPTGPRSSSSGRSSAKAGPGAKSRPKK